MADNRHTIDGAGFGDSGHDNQGIRLEGLQEADRRLWADDRANSLPPAGSPVAAPDLRLAELRLVPEISRVAALPGVLGREAGRADAFGDGRAFAADQAGRVESDRRRVPAELISVPRGFPSPKIGEGRCCVFMLSSIFHLANAPLAGGLET